MVQYSARQQAVEAQKRRLLTRAVLLKFETGSHFADFDLAMVEDGRPRISRKRDELSVI